MTTYEYRVIKTEDDTDKLAKEINKAAKEGWEPVETWALASGGRFGKSMPAHFVLMRKEVAA